MNSPDLRPKLGFPVILFQLKFNLSKASLTFLTALEVARVLELSESSASDFDKLNPLFFEILGSFSAIAEVSLLYKSNAPFAVKSLLESFSVKFVFSKLKPLFFEILGSLEPLISEISLFKFTK